jgi:hypothetical protein
MEVKLLSGTEIVEMKKKYPHTWQQLRIYIEYIHKFKSENN